MNTVTSNYSPVSRLLAAALVLLVLLTLPGVNAQTDEEYCDECCPSLLDLDALGLSAEQRRQIRAIQREINKRNWDIVGQIMDAEAQLEDLYDAPAPDRRKTEPLFGRIAELEKKMLQNDIDAWDRSRAVLTPEQRERLREIEQRSDCERPPAGTGRPV